MKRLISISCVAFAALIGHSQQVDCQPADTNVYTSSLDLNVRGLLFFKDNEFDSPLMDGYTLPGFRLNPTIEYRPTSAITIEAGAYLLHYWGAHTYPNVSYAALPDYSDKGSHGVHALPFLRMAWRTGDWRIVLGDIYDDGHNLLRPMYAPERQYTADPEAGVQILYDSKRLSLDLWLDWRTMIFNNSPYQENFFVGLSSRINYTRPDARVNVYTPVQMMIEHRGGEIDTITDNSVQTFINGAVGLGARFNVGHRMLRYVEVEVDQLGSWQQAGQTWPWEKGLATYAHASAQIWNVTAQIGYFDAHKFMSIQGLPLWSVAGMQTFRTNQMLYLGIGYEKVLHPGYTLSARTDLYQAHQKTSFSFEVAMRFTPSWKLK